MLQVKIATFLSDRGQISLYNFNTVSREKVMREKKIIKEEILFVITIRFSELALQEMCGKH